MSEINISKNDKFPLLRCDYYALQSGMAAVVVPLTSLYPAVIVGLSYLLLDERPTPAQWLGLVMVVGGGYLLVSGNGQEG